MDCPACNSWRVIYEGSAVDPHNDESPILADIYVCAQCGRVIYVHPVTGVKLEPEEKQQNPNIR